MEWAVMEVSFLQQAEIALMSLRAASHVLEGVKQARLKFLLPRGVRMASVQVLQGKEWQSAEMLSARAWTEPVRGIRIALKGKWYDLSLQPPTPVRTRRRKTTTDLEFLLYRYEEGTQTTGFSLTIACGRLTWIGPSTPEKVAGEAAKLLEEGKPGQALALCQQALSSSSHTEEATRLRELVDTVNQDAISRIQYLKGELKLARLTANTERLNSLVQRASTLARMYTGSRWQEEFDSLMRCMKDEISRLAKLRSDREASRILQRGLRYLQHGQKEMARACFETVLREYPQSACAAEARGKLQQLEK
jgi:tetratricopeptide (TPR) repeat protein